MLKLMWVDEKPMWIPVTEQEDAERVAMLEAVRNIPMRKSEPVRSCGYCYDTRDSEPGRHAKAEYSPETGGYDYFYMRMVREHNAEKYRHEKRRERAKQDKLRSKTYLRIITEVKPDAEIVALNDWLKYA